MNVYFGLGSNLGNRLQNLRDALEKLRTLGNVQAKSDVYETKAWGGIEQPDYLNACVKVKLTQKFSPDEILARVKNFEHEIGRVPSVRWGERKIDIDILLIDEMIYHSDALDVPHVQMCNRLFVLVPLEEILPENWKHPGNRKSVREMISELEGEAFPVRITRL